MSAAQPQASGGSNPPSSSKRRTPPDRVVFFFRVGRRADLNNADLCAEGAYERPQGRGRVTDVSGAAAGIRRFKSAQQLHKENL